MHWIDWLIVILPVLFVLGVAIYAKKFVRGVVDYLAAGRVAGRYVLTVGDMTSGLGILTLVAMTEQYYRCGIAVSFWAVMMMPIGMFVALSGWCVYRFRESKALSNGQFLEMRYSRSFRIVGSVIRIGAEMMTNAIGPAVAVNFFIYYLGLPHQIMVFGWAIPTFSLLVGAVLVLALIIILPGGRISLLITDSIQGLICYPVFVAIALFILVKFSWSDEIVPVMSNRIEGESFICPFDVEKLRDFNIFAMFVMVVRSIYNRASWAGNDTTSAGKTPHEQKMGTVLGVWRMGLGAVMCILIAFAIITFMNNPNYAENSHAVRQDLAKKVAAEAVTDVSLLGEVNNTIEAIPVLKCDFTDGEKLSQSSNLDTVYMEKIKGTLNASADTESASDTGESNLIFQKFRALYNQMMMPMGLRAILPVGLLGVFCLMAILLMVTTDDSRIFNASTAIIQDLVIPFKKEPMSPKEHMKCVKLCTVGVAIFFFFGSLFLSQLDFINMFIMIMTSIWLGGAAPVMVFGLYSRFGNTVGAYCSLIFGSGTGFCGLLIQRNWAEHVYPFLVNHGWVDGVGRFLEAVSGPFNPIIEWKMNDAKCPINSYELYFLAMVFGTVAYIAGSLLTYRGPFNLERLLHRGKYNTDNVEDIREPWTLRNMWSKIIGITPDYTRGDRIIVRLIFLYSFGYQFGLCFLLVALWNWFSPWPQSWWSTYYYIVYFVAGPIIGIVTTVWFFCGGLRDILRLFKDLALRIDNPLDNGMVDGHVALSDIEALGKDED